MKRRLLLSALVFMLAVEVSWAQVPGTMSYQGVLRDAGGAIVPDGDYSFTFSLYDVETGGTPLWSEAHSPVAVTQGVFNVILGGTNPLTIPFDEQYWLGVTVGVDAEMTPRKPLTSAAYSLSARSVAGAAGWSLTGNAGTNPATNFLGTTDNQAVELRVNGGRALRIEPHATSPNVIGGYSGNSVTEGVVGAFIGGGGYSGSANRVTDDYGTVCGGHSNTASGDLATVSGGYGNTASGHRATVGGGYGNTASVDFVTIAGGYNNSGSGWCATVGGGYVNRASGERATVGGGFGNQATADYATIAGGGRSDPGDPATANRVTDNYGTVGGGGNNQAGNANGDIGDASYATVAGGEGNTASGGWATVGGGYHNTASDYRATVAGGYENNAIDLFATVGGGAHNAASGGFATVGGGLGNSASSWYATVPGGEFNTAQGDYSFAAGRRAKANAPGSFVWGDSTNADIACDVDNQWKARCSGGVYFYSNSAATIGVKLDAGDNAWSIASDRAIKEDLTPVNGRAILEQLAPMPVQEYKLKGQEPSIRHIGPVAQDFSAAFGYGGSDTSIHTGDADGVALAAIQGLYELVEEKDAQIAGLEERLAALEALVSSRAE